MNDNFPPLTADAADESTYADIEGGGAMYQAGRVKAIFNGAFRGDLKDLAAVLGLLLGFGLLLLSLTRLTASKSIAAV